MVVVAALTGPWLQTLTVPAAAIGAVASGLLLGAALPGRRWVGAVVGAVLLAGVAVGARVSPWAAREAPAGLAHAMLYGALLVGFARSLRPGREPLVTGFARRLNPQFRPAMRPYTRGVTVAWCAFAAAQLLCSAGLLAVGALTPWALLVGPGHAVLAVALAGGEFALRCRRFPGERTGFWQTLRGVRRLSSSAPPSGS